jgi:ribosome biogenesis protein ERB1
MPAVGPASRSQPLKRKRNTKKESSISVPTDIPLAQLELNDSGGAPSHSGRAFDDDSNDEELFPEIDDTPGNLNEDDSASGSEEEMEGSSDESYLIEDSDFVDEVDSNDNGVGGDDLKEMKTSFRGETVLSKITGRPKRVYPTIEPDYDSDSSTEDVGGTPYFMMLVSKSGHHIGS